MTAFQIKAWRIQSLQLFFAHFAKEVTFRVYLSVSKNVILNTSETEG